MRGLEEGTVAVFPLLGLAHTLTHGRRKDMEEDRERERQKERRDKKEKERIWRERRE